MRFVILGAGALGSVMAALALAAGHTVEVIARGRRAGQLAEQGLRLQGLVDLAAPCAPRDAGAVDPRPDALLVTVKTWQMDSALAAVSHLEPAAVLSVANGVRKNEQLAACFGRDRVLGCMANFSADLQADGRVLFTRNECLHVGALTPAAAEPGARLVTAFEQAGLHAALEADITAVEWTKFASWVGFLALAVLVRRPTGELVADPGGARVMARIVREMVALAGAEGVELGNSPLMPVLDVAAAAEDEAVAMVQRIGAGIEAQAPGHRMSALQDVTAGRRLEVEETMGDALRRAARHGLAMPVLSVCYELASAVDRGHR